MSFWQNKVVVVTGGARGLGRALAEAFAAAQARVVLVAREAQRVEAAARQIQQAGGQALGMAADITVQDQVDRLFAKILRRFGRLDVLVNNAGRSMRGSVAQTTPEQFRELMELNFLGVVRCTRAALPHLLERRGHVVNIGSLAAKSAPRWVGAYAATKHAVAAYSQQLRLELGPQGLHVLLVCPGPVVRKHPRGEPLEGLGAVPAEARGPGAGVRLRPIRPTRLAQRVLDACQRRLPELVLPLRARILFALSQLCPRLGDWLLRRYT